MEKWIQRAKKYITGRRAAVFLLFLAAFLAGNLAGAVRERLTAASGVSVQQEAAGVGDMAAQPDVAGMGDTAVQPEAAGMSDTAAQPDVAGMSDTAARPEVAGMSDTAMQYGAAGTASQQGIAEMTGTTVQQEVAGAAGTSALQEAADGNWGLSFQEEGKPPVANATFEELAQFDAYYAENTEEKVLYLTFDCGYENGNTPKILEALKKHGVPATFFVVGNFVQDNPELIRQMAEEGHIVGNHTMHHPDMSQIADAASFQKELEGVAELYQEATGQEMVKYYRPPQGKYSEANLKMAQELGYQTFFWSLAYVDWYQDQQPTKEEAFEKLLGRIHPGAIVLLHNTSNTNGDILDELLTKWEEMGYSFRSLAELTGEADSQT